MKLSVPHIDKSDISYVKNVLKSEWISTSSKTVDTFEKKGIVSPANAMGRREVLINRND